MAKHCSASRFGESYGFEEHDSSGYPVGTRGYAHTSYCVYAGDPSNTVPAPGPTRTAPCVPHLFATDTVESCPSLRNGQGPLSICRNFVEASIRGSAGSAPEQRDAAHAYSSTWVLFHAVLELSILDTDWRVWFVAEKMRRRLSVVFCLLGVSVTNSRLRWYTISGAYITQG